MSHLLYLGYHAVANTRDAFGQHSVHHRVDDVQLVLDGEVDEVGIEQDLVGRA